MKYLKIWKKKGDYYYNFVDEENNINIDPEGMSTKDIADIGVLMNKVFDVVENAFDKINEKI